MGTRRAASPWDVREYVPPPLEYNVQEILKSFSLSSTIGGPSVVPLAYVEESQQATEYAVTNGRTEECPLIELIDPDVRSTALASPVRRGTARRARRCRPLPSLIPICRGTWNGVGDGGYADVVGGYPDGAKAAMAPLRTSYISNRQRSRRAQRWKPTYAEVLQQHISRWGDNELGRCAGSSIGSSGAASSATACASHSGWSGNMRYILELEREMAQRDKHKQLMDLVVPWLQRMDKHHHQTDAGIFERATEPSATRRQGGSIKRNAFCGQRTCTEPSNTPTPRKSLSPCVKTSAQQQQSPRHRYTKHLRDGCEDDGEVTCIGRGMQNYEVPAKKYRLNQPKNVRADGADADADADALSHIFDFSECNKLKQNRGTIISPRVKTPLLPHVEPVNSLQDRLNASPYLKANWFECWKIGWNEKKTLRALELNETVIIAERLTEERLAAEIQINERMRKFTILRPHLVIWDGFVASRTMDVAHHVKPIEGEAVEDVEHLAESVEDEKVKDVENDEDFVASIEDASAVSVDDFKEFDEAVEVEFVADESVKEELVEDLKNPVEPAADESVEAVEDFVESVADESVKDENDKDFVCIEDESVGDDGEFEEFVEFLDDELVADKSVKNAKKPVQSVEDVEEESAKDVENAKNVTESVEDESVVDVEDFAGSTDDKWVEVIEDFKDYIGSVEDIGNLARSVEDVGSVEDTNGIHELVENVEDFAESVEDELVVVVDDFVESAEDESIDDESIGDESVEDVENVEDLIKSVVDESVEDIQDVKDFVDSFSTEESAENELGADELANAVEDIKDVQDAKNTVESVEDESVENERIEDASTVEESVDNGLTKPVVDIKDVQDVKDSIETVEEDTIEDDSTEDDSVDNGLANAVVDVQDFLQEVDDHYTDCFYVTNEQEMLVAAAISGLSNQVLITKFSMNITRSDIHSLLTHNWLNDAIINFYMNLLTERSEKRHQSGGLPRVYAMNTFFLPRLLQAGHAGVKRWTRKVDIFSMDIIPVPVFVRGVHWCMAIVHLKNCTIKYYDSMGNSNPDVLKVLEQYLQAESLDKRQQPFDTSGFEIVSEANVPRQANGSDCGVFSCMFAEYITRNREITFTQEHMQYFRLKMILEVISGELL